MEKGNASVDHYALLFPVDSDAVPGPCVRTASYVSVDAAAVVLRIRFAAGRDDIYRVLLLGGELEKHVVPRARTAGEWFF